MGPSDRPADDVDVVAAHSARNALSVGASSRPRGHGSAGAPSDHQKRKGSGGPTGAHSYPSTGARLTAATAKLAGDAAERTTQLRAKTIHRRD
jgi:hypothetical protein